MALRVTALHTRNLSGELADAGSEEGVKHRAGPDTKGSVRVSWRASQRSRSYEPSADYSSQRGGEGQPRPEMTSVPKCLAQCPPPSSLSHPVGSRRTGLAFPLAGLK